MAHTNGSAAAETSLAAVGSLSGTENSTREVLQAKNKDLLF